VISETSGSVVLTYKLCFWSSQHDIPKNLKIVIYPGFSDVYTFHFAQLMNMLELDHSKTSWPFHRSKT
jgi:hypothetical protein